MITIFIIGTGNLGTQLCQAIESTNSKQIQLIGYANKSNEIVAQINAPLISNRVPDCDLTILAVPDDAIAAVSSKITTDSIVVHTSGSAPMNILESHSNHGVFYIPQTFSKNRSVDFSDVTICLESSNNNVMKQLEVLASSLSRKRKPINSHQRQQLHLAAVYMNNFVNHCYFKSSELLKNANLEAELLEPLMNETLAKAQDSGSFAAQTGPARRGDDQTIQRHLQQLKELDREMYLALSESIKNTYET